MLMDDVSAVQSLNGAVLLAGDFNARTSNQADFLAPSYHTEFLCPYLPAPEALPDNIHSRSSADQGPLNQFGKKLLALCQDSNLLILNGRAEGDEQGCCTCHTHNGASLVDYFISSPSLLELKPALHVQEQPPDSDHCPLQLLIPLTCQAPRSNSPCTLNLPKLRYMSARVEQYCSVLANTLHFHFEAGPSDQCYATTIQECIVHAASQVHGYSRGDAFSRPMHAWYDEECKALRTQLNSISHSDPQFILLRKEYARVKRRKRRQAQLASQQQLCEQAYHDARAFWCRYRKRGQVLGNISSQQWHSAFKDLFGPEAGLAPPTQGQGQPQGENSELNDMVTPTEVKAAFQRLKRHKAAGMDGIKAEFLLDAEDMLIQPLAVTFTQMLSHGVPQSWCTGVIHPIFKSGDADDPSNYRGITVTSVLAKVFAMIIETRLSAWAEDHNLRAEGQAGFRKDHRTVDNIFIMHTLISKARKSKRKLYCCFVDFKKAFDSVPRHSLWQVLESLGVTGDILYCLKSIYDKDEACVLTGEGLSDSFRCTTGVKQGCPASPLLFGLYIDEIEALLKEAKDDIDAPMLLQTLVAILLFADDIALFSYSAQGLQAQLDILQKFCCMRGLTVNVAKTKVIVFESRRSQSPTFTYDGEEVERVEEFKYLGICFHATRGMSCAIQYLCNSARKAVFGLLGRCHELHICQPLLKLKLFDALVRPIMLYACEVWAIVGGKQALEDMERVEIRFLKMLLGVPQNTSSKLVHAEFGRLPLKHCWLQQCIKYLKRFLSLDDNRLCKTAFSADVQSAAGWYHGLSRQLRLFGIHLPRDLSEIDCDSIAHEVKDQAILAGMSACDGNHLEMAYFSFKVHFRVEPYISEAKNKHLRKSIAMFRVGSHWLGVRTGRLQGVPFMHRKCPTCNCIDDEKHAIFQCPIYRQARAKYPDLFCHAEDLTAFLTRNPCHRVALFLSACREARLNHNTIRYPAHYADADLGSIEINGVKICDHHDWNHHDTYDSDDSLMDLC